MLSGRDIGCQILSCQGAQKKCVAVATEDMGIVGVTVEEERDRQMKAMAPPEGRS